MEQLSATHNSASGLSNYGLLSWLVAPFSRCQKYAPEEQVEGGVRLLDLRVMADSYGVNFCHGLWRSKESVTSVFDVLDRAASKKPWKVYYILTHEHRFRGKDNETGFMAFASYLREEYPHLIQLQVLVKQPKWRELWRDEKETVRFFSDYEKLVWPNLKMLLPIPRLWAWLHKPQRQELENDTYRMVDFWNCKTIFDK